MLWLQKLLVAAVSPLSVAILLYLIGIVLFVLNKGRKAALTAFVVGFLIIVLPGYGIFNGKLKQIEKKYKPLTNIQSILESPNGSAQYVVVLGSGHVSNPQFPATSQINADSLFRLVEGIRLYRAIPGAELFLSGGPGFDTTPNAEIMASVAEQMGIQPKDIVIENTPTNTEEEAKLVKRKIGNSPFILVTSSMHMPRAISIFQQHGMNPVPAPTDFIFKRTTAFSPRDLFPSCNNIAMSERLLYEYLGKLWLRLKTSITGKDKENSV